MLTDIVINPDPDCSLFPVLSRPGQLGFLEAVIKNEQLAILVKGSPGLNQCSGGLAGLDNDRGLAECRHGLVAFREEPPVPLPVPCLVALNRNLADDQAGFWLSFSGVPRSPWDRRVTVVYPARRWSDHSHQVPLHVLWNLYLPQVRIRSCTRP